MVISNKSYKVVSKGYSNDYFGVPMFWSHYIHKQTLEIIKNSGFVIEWNDMLDIGGEKQFWVLARNKK